MMNDPIFADVDDVIRETYQVLGEDVPRAVDERQRRERDEVRAGALREGVDGEPSHSEAVHF